MNKNLSIAIVVIVIIAAAFWWIKAQKTSAPANEGASAQDSATVQLNAVDLGPEASEDLKSVDSDLNQL